MPMLWLIRLRSQSYLELLAVQWLICILRPEMLGRCQRKDSATSKCVDVFGAAEGETLIGCADTSNRGFDSAKRRFDEPTEPKTGSPPFVGECSRGRSRGWKPTWIDYFWQIQIWLQLPGNRRPDTVQLPSPPTTFADMRRLL